MDRTLEAAIGIRAQGLGVYGLGGWFRHGEIWAQVWHLGFRVVQT